MKKREELKGAVKHRITPLENGRVEVGTFGRYIGLPYDFLVFDPKTGVVNDNTESYYIDDDFEFTGDISFRQLVCNGNVTINGSVWSHLRLIVSGNLTINGSHYSYGSDWTKGNQNITGMQVIANEQMVDGNQYVKGYQRIGRSQKIKGDQLIEGNQFVVEFQEISGNQEVLGTSNVGERKVVGKKILHSICSSFGSNYYFVVFKDSDSIEIYKNHFEWDYIEFKGLEKDFDPENHDPSISLFLPCVKILKQHLDNLNAI